MSTVSPDISRRVAFSNSSRHTASQCRKGWPPSHIKPCARTLRPATEFAFCKRRSERGSTPAEARVCGRPPQGLHSDRSGAQRDRPGAPLRRPPRALNGTNTLSRGPARHFHRPVFRPPRAVDAPGGRYFRNANLALPNRQFGFRLRLDGDAAHAGDGKGFWP